MLRAWKVEARIPSRHSALMPSASISMGKLTVRSKRPLRRSRRWMLPCSSTCTFLVPAMRMVLPLASMRRSAFCTPGTSVMITTSSPLRNTFKGGYEPPPLGPASSQSLERSSSRAC